MNINYFKREFHIGKFSTVRRLLRNLWKNQIKVFSKNPSFVLLLKTIFFVGFPCGTGGKECSELQETKEMRFDLCVGKIP